jgi:23S rRNA (cytidine1920-2'-O)/16S rRNA (cytidine1409-2'-O)-methyltransferase
MAERRRLDVLLTDRGLVPSRERARAVILAGRVEVDGRRLEKAGALVATDADVRLVTPDHPYVGRGGVKLAHALARFGLAVGGASALDIGASTGGFTDALLQAGARHVVAVDVGRGQLAWALRTDPRVTPIEGLNARYLAATDLPAEWMPFDLVTLDVSFISVRHILPRLPPLVAPGGSVVVLVKPQFEAGRTEVGRGGIVRSEAVRRRVVAEVRQLAASLGLDPLAEDASPITGADGNHEYLLHLVRT